MTDLSIHPEWHPKARALRPDAFPDASTVRFDDAQARRVPTAPDRGGDAARPIAGAQVARALAHPHDPRHIGDTHVG